MFGERAFTGVAGIRPDLADRIHIVWAFSKDFGASGLRCGVLVSENRAVNAAVDAFAYWACTVETGPGRPAAVERSACRIESGKGDPTTSRS